MKIFSKLREQRNNKQKEIGDLMTRYIEVKQRSLANYLNEKVNSLSGLTKLMLFLLFCALLTTINIYLIVQ